MFAGCLRTAELRQPLIHLLEQQLNRRLDMLRFYRLELNRKPLDQQRIVFTCSFICSSSTRRGIPSRQTSRSGALQPKAALNSGRLRYYAVHAEFAGRMRIGLRQQPRLVPGVDSRTRLARIQKELLRFGVSVHFPVDRLFLSARSSSKARYASRTPPLSAVFSPRVSRPFNSTPGSRTEALHIRSRSNPPVS